MKEVFIVAAKRTPMGSFGGQLAAFSAVDLGVVATKSAIEQSSINPEQVDEIFYGNVCSANLGQAPARQVALKSGVTNKVPSTTINKVCASGMKATMIGAQSIQAGTNELVITGGMESMSNIPFYMPKARWGAKYGHAELLDGLQKDGLTDAYDHQAMGFCGDATATKYEISREEQDAYAIRSYERAAAAAKSGKFENEIAPVSIPQKGKDPILMSEDEEFKNVRFDKIPDLRPVFSKDGTVTAANASTINDGAATLILASAEYVKEHQLKPLAKIVSYADAAHEPQWFTTAPVEAAQKALKNAGLSIDDIDFFEVNEAFAVVAQVFAKSLNVDAAKMNINGGAVALGHPLGCSGARILVTLINVLKENKGNYGLAAICNGGGGASAMIIQNVD
ncbi:MAG: acetyl-CoA C-acyltransferase [Saprospiraceae bacterium]|nr:acetyl-CoA C-acyltransferase [Saprospiraceae bacterium]